MQVRKVLIALVTIASGCSRGGDNETSDSGASTTGTGSWQRVFSDLPGGLMSVWGASSSDVWAVGSNASDARGALILHYDGVGWARIGTRITADLWWVHGFDGGPVFMGGSRGTILRTAGNELERFSTPSIQGTVFGVWGPDPSDVWAVGGDTMGTGGAFVWRYDGARWQEVDGLPVDPKSAVAFFKVWGSSSADVWVVGIDGMVLHYDGSRFTKVPTDASDPFFTVHSTPTTPISRAAVGGFDLGVMLESTGEDSWQQATLPAGTRQLFGVWLTSERDGYAVGADARVLARSRGVWSAEDTGLPVDKALHSVWVDPDEGVWTVGGDVLFPPLGAGMLLHKGASLPDTYELSPVDLLEPTEGAGGSGGVSPGSTCSPDAGGGSSGGSMETDATDTPSSAGFVMCGAGVCDLATSHCCVDPAVDSAECVPTGQDCEPGYAMHCDETSDCSSGRICCVRRFVQLARVADITCQASCLGETLCASTSECGEGRCCIASAIAAGYTGCR